MQNVDKPTLPISVIALVHAIIFSGCTNTIEVAKCTPSPPNQNHLSVMTYNVHLFDLAHIVAAAGPLKIFLEDVIDAYLHAIGSKSVDYVDEERFQNITNHLLSMRPSPDVVVFNELWNDNLANLMIEALRCRYPYQFRPDSHEDIFKGEFVGNGLLLLSKHPIARDSKSFELFNELMGEDTYSMKGIAKATIEFEQRSPVTIFFTHANAGENQATFNNIDQLANAVKQFRQIHPDEAVIVAGDLNVDGDEAGYKQMMKSIGLRSGAIFKDAYREYNPDVSSHPGYTFDFESNELLKIFSYGEGRLDYILYIESKPLHGISNAIDGNPRFPPTGAAIKNEFYFFDVVANKRLPLSDHYPLIVDFVLN